MFDYRHILPALMLLSGLLSGGVASAVSVDAAFVGSHVEAHVREQLKQYLPEQPDERITVQILNLPGGGSLDVPEAEVLADVRVQADSNLDRAYANRAIVRIGVGVKDGPVLREFGVPVRITIEKPVWVVKHLIQAGEPVSTRHLALESRDVSRDYSHVVGKQARLSQYEARVNLRPGDVLDNRKIVIPPDVRRFTDVRIILSNGKGMQVSVPGTALSDGRVGETIQVRQQERTRKTFSGQVIDKNRVLVEI